MRLKRTNLIIGLCLIIWASVIYFFLVADNPFSSQRRHHLQEALIGGGGRNLVDKQISALEQGISDQFQMNNNMIYETRKFLERKRTEHEVDVAEKRIEDTKIPVLVFACNRVSVSRCLDRLIQYRPDPDKFPIIVSQVSDQTTSFNKIIFCFLIYW